MRADRPAYPSDVSDDEWALAAPYLALLREDSAQRDHALREVFNGLRFIVKTGAPWRFMPHDLPPWAAVHQQTRRWLAAESFAAVAGDLRAVLRPAMAWPVAPANGDRRAEAGRPTEAAQNGAGGRAGRGFVDQGREGSDAAARGHGIAGPGIGEHGIDRDGISLEAVEAPGAKRGVVLLPRRWMAEGSAAWARRCRRLIKDYERYATTLAGLCMIAGL